MRHHRTKQAPPPTMTAADLTNDIVRAAHAKLLRFRDASYLCRAYLQFGPETMSAEHLTKLCACLERVQAKEDDR